MAATMAVLSYTRKDDEFFNNYITAFRRMLETAVHVATGSEDFHIFQDVEDIQLGEQWQKKLADTIPSADCFVPMLTPLFFNSPYCRMEVDLFLAHEQQLGRDDLVLPVYFLSSPKLEKEEEKAKDPLALELAKRQMFDWRETANLPLDVPEARKALLELGKAVGGALERMKTAPQKPPRESVAARSERFLAEGTEPGSLHGAMPGRETLSERIILWVDDNPDNNVWERRALESYGVRFRLATDTAQARTCLTREPLDAIISDLSRPGDRRAGYTLLAHVRGAGMQTPYFIYSSSRAPERVREAIARGAQGATNDPDELVAMVIAAVRLRPDTAPK